MYVDATKIDQEWCFEFKNMTVSQVRLIKVALEDIVETTKPHVSSIDRELATVILKRIEQTLIK